MWRRHSRAASDARAASVLAAVPYGRIAMKRGAGSEPSAYAPRPCLCKRAQHPDHG